MRSFVAFITLITLASAPVFADVRDDAKSYLAREWRVHPEHCLEALRLVVENDQRRAALQELERDLIDLWTMDDQPLTIYQLDVQIKAIYSEASKFYDPSGKTDDLWELVAKSPLAPDPPPPGAAPAPAPKRDPNLANTAVCLSSYIFMKNLVYPGSTSTLDAVRELYQQKLYLKALYELLYEEEYSSWYGRIAGYANTLANYRACYAVPPDSGKYELFELVQTVLGK